MMELATCTLWKVEALQHAIVEMVMTVASVVEACEELFKQRDWMSLKEEQEKEEEGNDLPTTATLNVKRMLRFLVF